MKDFYLENIGKFEMFPLVSDLSKNYITDGFFEIRSIFDTTGLLLSDYEELAFEVKRLFNIQLPNVFSIYNNITYPIASLSNQNPLLLTALSNTSLLKSDFRSNRQQDAKIDIESEASGSASGSVSIKLAPDNFLKYSTGGNSTKNYFEYTPVDPDAQGNNVNAISENLLSARSTGTNNSSTGKKTVSTGYTKRNAKGVKINSELLSANVGGIPTTATVSNKLVFKTSDITLTKNLNINYSNKLEVENKPCWFGIYTKYTEEV